MEISAKSYLVAGTAAVVGAGAIALTPALPSNAVNVGKLPAPTVAQVALTGYDFSLNDVLGVLQSFGGGLLPDLGGLSPTAIPAIVFEFAKEAGPVVLATAGDIFTNAGNAVLGLVTGPNSIPTQFGSAIAGIPGAVMTAIGNLQNADFAGALKVINDGLLAPAKAIGEVIYQTVSGVIDYASVKLDALATALPDILATAVKAVTGVDATALIDSIKTAITGLIDKLSNAGFPGGWSGGWSEDSHHHFSGSSEGHHDGSGEGSGTDSDDDDVTPVAAASVAAVAAPKATAPAAAASEPTAPAGDKTPDVSADGPKVAASGLVDAQPDSAAGSAPVRRGAAIRSAIANAISGAEGAVRGHRQDTERPRSAAARAPR